MLNNWVNFQFSIMKKLWDLAQENLVNIQGSYGILDQYFWMSDILLTWPSISSKTIAIVRHCRFNKRLSRIFDNSESTSRSRQISYLGIRMAGSTFKNPIKWAIETSVLGSFGKSWSKAVPWSSRAHQIVSLKEIFY